MALVNVGKIVYPPPLLCNYVGNNVNVSFGNSRILALNLNWDILLQQAQYSDTITAFSFYCTASSMTGVLRASFESLDANGLPSGSLLAAGAYVDFTVSAGAEYIGWHTQNLVTPLPLVVGQLFAIVVKILSVSAGTTISIAGHFNQYAETQQFPLSTRTQTGLYSGIESAPLSFCMALTHQSDGLKHRWYGISAYNQMASSVLISTTGRDECGSEIPIPFSCRIVAIKFCIADFPANSVMRLNVRINDSNLVVAYCDFTGHIMVATNIDGQMILHLNQPVIVSAGDIVKTTVKQISGSSGSIVALSLNDSSFIPASEFGEGYNQIYTTGGNGTEQALTWTRNSLVHPIMHAVIDQLDDGQNSGSIIPIGEILMRDTYNLTTGDDFILPITLTENESNPTAVNLSAATINVAVISKNFSTRYSEQVAQSSGHAGANWALGQLVIDLPKANTAPISAYVIGRLNAWLEIEVTIGTVTKSWYQAITVTLGHIEEIPV